MPEKELMRALRRLLNHHERAHGADPTGHNLDCCISRGENQPSLCYEAYEARQLLAKEETVA